MFAIFGKWSQVGTSLVEYAKPNQSYSVTEENSESVLRKILTNSDREK